MGIAGSIIDLIGQTPLVEISRFSKHLGLRARVLVKPEYLNPAGSVKDRAALSLLDEAQAAGQLAPGATLIEPTSGNTGIALAALGAVMGYRVILTMPDTMSRERRQLLQAYGAQLVLTPGAEGMRGAIAKAKELQKQIPGSLIPGQFDNPANALAHYRTTGPEIDRDTAGQVDFFVAGAGTGGTLTGTGRYLKERHPALRVVAVEPASSPVLSGGDPGPHGLMGIGAGFVPAILDTALLDEIIPVTEQEAYAAARLLSRTEGMLTGITSGAALHAATLIARREENAGKTLVVLLPDGGDRYLSTSLYAGDEGLGIRG